MLGNNQLQKVKYHVVFNVCKELDKLSKEIKSVMW